MAGRPKTYQEKYLLEPDVLGGDYTHLYSRFDLATARTGQEIRDQVLLASNAIPKAYLFLCNHNNTPTVEVLFRPSRFASDLTTVSQWDDLAFGFLGDVLPGNHIEMVGFPTNAFTRTTPQLVPTLAAMDAAVGLLDPLQDSFIPAPAVGTADTEQVSTRVMVQVPHTYLATVFNRQHTPISLWTDLGGAIVNDGLEAELAPLLDWMRVSLTQRVDQNNQVRDPTTMLGDKHTVFPALRFDASLQQHRWNIIRGDLPALDPTTVDNTDRVLAVTDVLREERRQEAAARAAERVANSAPKLPSSEFPASTDMWKLLAGAADEMDLPEFYHKWANSKKADRRRQLQTAFNQRAKQPGAATRIPPIATKELHDMVLQCEVAPSLQQGNKLNVGINPFTCGNFMGQRNSQVQVRAETHDLVLEGLVAPTIAEQERFVTKEVTLPASSYQGGLMLKLCSIVLDCIQTPGHPHATAFRLFVLNDWPEIETHLELGSNPSSVGNIVPRIVRTVAVRMGYYLNRLLDGRDPALPDYNGIAELVLTEQYSQLATLPHEYLAGRPTGATPRVPAAPGAAAPGATPPAAPGARDPGVAAANPAPVTAWLSAWSASNLRLQQVRSHAPKTTDPVTGQEVEICLSYHLKGTCFANCQRRPTHRALNTSERAKMTRFVREQLQAPPGGATGTPPAAPTRPPAAGPAAAGGPAGGAQI